MKKNGTRTCRVHSIHGDFEFRLQRFTASQHAHTDFLQMSGPLEPGGVSHRLAEFCCAHANRLSFRDLQRLLHRLRGALPRQTLHDLVQRVALDISREQHQAIRDTETLELPALETDFDLYDPESQEVLLFEDGILVKAQKPHRGPDADKPHKFVSTDVVMLQQPGGSFRTLTEGIAAGLEPGFGIAQALRAAFVNAWGSASKPLRVVAITDGARAIRRHLESVFGGRIEVVLDWYHLQKKLTEKLSQICFGVKHRKAAQAEMSFRLWNGDVKGALMYLWKLKPRKEEAYRSLELYLMKHSEELIDYGRRQAAGHPIGSGRMEKGVDLAIGHRQKKKGMSWNEPGSRVLAHLRCVELNDEWDGFWERRAAA